MSERLSEKTYTVNVKYVPDGATGQSVIDKVAGFCKGANREQIELAMANVPFSFRRMSFDSAQAAKEELENLGCAVDIKEGSGLSSPEEGLVFQDAKRRHKLRLAKGVDEDKLLERIKVFAGDDIAVEAYRTLRTNLLVKMNEEGTNSFLFTSSGPKEGKTTTVVNLGIALASAGKKTILVDMDLRSPMLHSVMGIDNSIGIANIVLDGLAPDTAISHTLQDRLHILPSGPVLPNPAELLSSKVVRELLAQLSDEFDVVLLDSPPVTGLTDAVVIGAMVGNAFLVVRAAHTPRQQAAHAARILENVKCRVLGVVLNEIDVHKPFYRVYTYSGRGRG